MDAREALTKLKPRQINDIISAVNGGRSADTCKAAQTSAGKIVYADFKKELSDHPGAYLQPVELDDDELEESSVAMFG